MKELTAISVLVLRGHRSRSRFRRFVELFAPPAPSGGYVQIKLTATDGTVLHAPEPSVWLNEGDMLTLNVEHPPGEGNYSFREVQ